MDVFNTIPLFLSRDGILGSDGTLFEISAELPPKSESFSEIISIIEHEGNTIEALLAIIVSR